MDRGELYIRLEALYRYKFMLNRYAQALDRQLMDAETPELFDGLSCNHSRRMLFIKTACLIQHDRDLNK